MPIVIPGLLIRLAAWNFGRASRCVTGILSEDKMPIKVLHIIGSLGCGGAQVVLKHLVENTDGKQVEVFVYPLRSRDVRIPIQGQIITRPYCNYDPRKFFTILRLCKQHDIDIIVAHLSKPIMACLFASFFSKSGLIIYEHGPVIVKGPQYSLYRLVLRLLWRRADIFIAVSQSIADYLIHKIGISPDRVRVIYNPVQTDVFDHQRISAGAARERLGISGNDIVLGFVGSLSLIKGADLLIKATALLLQRSQRYLLLVAGEGPDRKSLVKLAQRLGIDDRIRFLGFCDNVPEVMAAFDIGIVPSRQESFGIVCLELMSMKVPLISSGVGGMTEYITNEETGLLLKENTPEEICRCVERLVNDEQLRQRLIENGSRLAQQFGADRYVKAYQQIYQEVLNQDES
jgi:glycosyltransferase involved in cell wall biosynthesis